MELLLNLVWLVVACSALAHWGRQRAHVPADGRRAWRLELCALGCALVLLFPIISLSDDLQAEPAAVEAARPSGQKTVKDGSDGSSVATATLLPALPGTVSATWLPGCSTLLFALVDHAPVARSEQFARSLALRAPPLA